MASIRHSIEMNKKILLLILALLLFIIAFLVNFYREQKSENDAIRIKILSLSENKKMPKAWSEIIAKPNPKPSASVPAAPSPTAAPAVVIGQDLASLDTQELATQLDAQMKNIKNAEVEAIDKNISMADEIISREPDSYSAYKAKLISLLTKEGKFNQEVDDSEVNDLLENMAQFNTGSDSIARREVALIGETNEQIKTMENEIEKLALQREVIEAQLSSLDPEDPERAAALNEEIRGIEELQSRSLADLETLEAEFANSTAQAHSEDIVEIPFMRMLAKSDYEAVVDDAEDFIGKFPNSPSGYFYLIKALELQGKKEEVSRVLQDIKLPQNAQQILLQKLESQAGEEPKNYWKKLSF